MGCDKEGLKPCKDARFCSYCGCTKLFMDWDEHDMCRYDRRFYKIVCDGCGARGPEYFYDSKDLIEKEKEATTKALIAWNTGKKV